ncbi:hypothetical protein QAD02_022426 [Eretmocerus hayati]|uniref:Uncharacterized protein n=1 Tax=Eretmocerus hayati TaxID=131215 RepID=A0ACC2PT83_9HYME|nr:hypothetical protein QAD02_022426 [Eretmocerus hayati]
MKKRILRLPHSEKLPPEDEEDSEHEFHYFNLSYVSNIKGKKFSRSNVGANVLPCKCGFSFTCLSSWLARPEWETLASAMLMWLIVAQCSLVLLNAVDDSLFVTLNTVTRLANSWKSISLFSYRTKSCSSEI